PGVDTNGNPFFNVQSTPGATLGREDTYFGNMTVVLKGLLYHDTCNHYLISGGSSVTIPTAPDTHLTVIDYTGTSGGNNSGTTASGQIRRDITIGNETWSVSPFLAALYTPSDRLFT